MNISVVITTFNGSKTIEKALNSLIQQEVNSRLLYEIIVVDNNSTDNTAELVRKMIKSYPDKNISLIKECKQGPVHGRHTGLLKSKYEIILFLDDDMIAMSNYIESYSNLFKSDQKLGLAGAKIRVPESYEEPKYMNTIKSVLAINETFDFKNYFVPSMQAIRKEAYMFFYNNGFEQKLLFRKDNKYKYARGQDIEFSLALRYTPYHCGFNKDTYLIHDFGTERLKIENIIDLKQQVGYALAIIAPYKYVFKSSKKTSYYYYLIRSTLSLLKVVFKENRKINLNEKYWILRTLILTKKDYQDLEKEIYNAKWNVLDL